MGLFDFGKASDLKDMIGDIVRWVKQTPELLGQAGDDLNRLGEHLHTTGTRLAAFGLG